MLVGFCARRVCTRHTQIAAQSRPMLTSLPRAYSINFCVGIPSLDEPSLVLCHCRSTSVVAEISAGTLWEPVSGACSIEFVSPFTFPLRPLPILMDRDQCTSNTLPCMLSLMGNDFSMQMQEFLHFDPSVLFARASEIFLRRTFIAFAYGRKRAHPPCGEITFATALGLAVALLDLPESIPTVMICMLSSSLYCG